MDVLTAVCLAVLALGALICVSRLVVGPSLADRVVALDAFVLVSLSGVALASARWRSDLFVDVVLVGSLIGFVGTLTVARFIERRGAR